MFYKGINPGSLISRAYETASGKLFFIESGANSTGQVISIYYNRPMHSRANLSVGIKGDFQSVYPMISGELLVSFRSSESDKYGLYRFESNKEFPGKPLYKSDEYSVSDVLVIENSKMPKKLPSEVDMGVKTGLLLCQNVNVLNLNHNESAPVTAIKVMGKDSLLGIVSVEKDGSFYLKIKADMPFQIRTLDENGKVTGGSCSWIWLRPNERRGCVGCHEDPEQVPENQVPLAVKKSPVNLPVHLTKIKEKAVELE